MIKFVGMILGVNIGLPVCQKSNQHVSSFRSLIFNEGGLLYIQFETRYIWLSSRTARTYAFDLATGRDVTVGWPHCLRSSSNTRCMAPQNRCYCWYPEMIVATRAYPPSTASCSHDENFRFQILTGVRGISVRSTHNYARLRFFYICNGLARTTVIPSKPEEQRPIGISATQYSSQKTCKPPSGHSNVSRSSFTIQNRLLQTKG